MNGLKKDDPTDKVNYRRIWTFFKQTIICGFRKVHSTINTLYLNYYIVGKKSLITLVSLAEFSWNSLKRMTAYPMTLLLQKFKLM